MEDPTFGAAPRPQAGPFGRAGAGPGPAAAPPGDGVAHLIDRLSDRFEQLEYTVIDHLPPPEDRGEARAALDERLSSIERSLAGCGTRGLEEALAGILELQRRQAEEIEALRRELAAERSREFDALRAELAAVRARIEAAAMAAPGWVDPLVAALAPPPPEVTREALDDLFGALSARIDRLAARPAPAPDLTAQRQSLARFMSAGNTFLRRLETLVAGLAGEYLRLAEKVDGPPREDEADRVAELTRVVAALSEATSRLAAFAAAAPDALAQDQREFINDLRVTVAELVAEAERTRAAG